MIKEVVSMAMPLDERIMIRKNVISSGSSKKRVCIVTGTHGDELEGQYVCYKLANELQANLDKLDGTVEIYPALNPLGIDTISRGIPGFDLDMNRIFPGNADGVMAESIAAAILEDLKGADMVIDIHSSNIFLREMPQVRINVTSSETLVPQAKLLGVDFIWVHDAATVLEATLAHSLNSTGTPCLVVEMGVGMRINHSLGNNLVDGIYNLLNSMGMWSGEVDKSNLADGIISEGDSVSFLNAAKSGIFLTELKTSAIVEKGDLIGTIVDPLSGEILEPVLSPVYGYLFTLRAYPVVYEGSLLARIHELER
ncbi:MAG: M14 family metallopeptidase [Rikenellaceae bacterium]